MHIYVCSSNLLQLFFYTSSWSVNQMPTNKDSKLLSGHIKWQFTSLNGSKGRPRWLSGKESACQCRRPGFNPWVRKTPWRRKWQSTPALLPGKSHRQTSLAGYTPRGRKSWTRLSPCARRLSSVCFCMLQSCSHSLAWSFLPLDCQVINFTM